jgi:hypothetical protein
MRMPNRRPRLLIAALGASIALLTVIAPVAAATPKPATIDVVNTFAGDPTTGTFTAVGSAVDSGLICPSGTTVDTRNGFAGGQSGRKLQILVIKEFTCEDGSGTFLIKMQVHIDFATGETFTWVVLSGTGEYGHLQGSGQGVTASLPDDPAGVGHNQNTYSGFLN